MGKRMIGGYHGNPGFLIDRNRADSFLIVRFQNNRQVTELFFDTVEHIVRVAVPQIILYMRITLVKPCNPLGKQAWCMTFHGGKIECSLKSFFHFADFFNGFIDQIDNLPCVLPEKSSFFGQYQRMVIADKKLYAKFVFQIFDLAAERRLGDTQFFSGFCKI